MARASELPVVRVHRDGMVIKSVDFFDPPRDIGMTDLERIFRIERVEATLDATDLPKVSITFLARLEDVQA